MALVDVVAHITGTVWKYEVKVGDEIEEDDVVVILESMKMEMPVVAPMPVESPCDGTLKEICIEEGQPVNEGDVLARIEEE